METLNNTLLSRAGDGHYNLGDDVTNKLSEAVVNHPKFIEISESLSTLKNEEATTACIEVMKNQIAETKAVLTAVDTTTRTINTNIDAMGDRFTSSHLASDREMLQLRKNSDESLMMFGSMKNIRRFEDTLYCDIKIISNYHLEHHPDAKDPDAYLQCMINQHLVGKTGYSFVIIATDSNDITCMETEHESAVAIFEQVKGQSDLLCEIVQTIITIIGVDVFIVEKPPRYDPVSKDPTSMKQKLSKYSNAVPSTSLGLTQRAFLVEQGSLGRSSGKARN